MFQFGGRHVPAPAPAAHCHNDTHLCVWEQVQPVDGGNVNVRHLHFRHPSTIGDPVMDVFLDTVFGHVAPLHRVALPWRQHGWANPVCGSGQRGRQGQKKARLMIMEADKVNLRVALMAYIVFGGLHNARLPLRYPDGMLPNLWDAHERLALASKLEL